MKKYKVSVSGLMTRLNRQRPAATIPLREMAEAGLLSPKDDVVYPEGSSSDDELIAAFAVAWMKILEDRSSSKAQKLQRCERVLGALDVALGTDIVPSDIAESKGFQRYGSGKGKSVVTITESKKPKPSTTAPTNPKEFARWVRQS